MSDTRERPLWEGRLFYATPEDARPVRALLRQALFPFISVRSAVAGIPELEVAGTVYRGERQISDFINVWVRDRAS